MIAGHIPYHLIFQDVHLIFFARNCLRDGVFNRVIYSFIRSVTSGDVIYDYEKTSKPLCLLYICSLIRGNVVGHIDDKEAFSVFKGGGFGRSMVSSEACTSPERPFQ